MKAHHLICLSATILTLSLSVKAEEAIVKNVLFIVSDDLKASALGAYGNTICQTPNIDGLASKGLVFERAYCQGMWCKPSRDSFMFSRYRGKDGINMAEHLKNQGWYTARAGKIYHMRVPGDIIDGTDGLDVPSSWVKAFNSQGKEAHTPGEYACLNKDIFTTKLKGRESTQMKNRMFVSVSYKGDGSDQPDYKTADKVIELLEAHKDNPFFIAAGLVRPHYPNVAPTKYFDLYPWQDMPLPEVPKNDIADIPPAGRARVMNGNNSINRYPDNQKRMWAAYYATVTFMDEQVGRMLDALDALGLRDSTAVVFISDHGYNLGEHTFWEKSVLHEEVSRVPMIVSVPGMAKGKTESITELMDLYPTLCDLLGVAVPESVQGKSLVPVLNDSEHHTRDNALFFSRKGVALRSHRFAYMQYHTGEEELYEMKKDPGQFTNQAYNPEYQDTLETMRHTLTDRLKKNGLKIPNKK